MKNDKNEKPVVIGKARVLFDDIFDWIESDEFTNFYDTKNLWQPYLYELQGKIAGVSIHNVEEESSNLRNAYYKNKFSDLRSYIEDVLRDVEYPFDLIYVHDVFVIVSFGGLMYLLPRSLVRFLPFADYSEKSVGELKSLCASQDTQNGPDLSLVASDDNLSLLSEKAQKERILSKIDEINKLNEDMNDVKSAKTGELAELQRQIDEQIAALEAKKSEMLAVLEAKKAEMDAQKEKLEQQLFILESEIYSIRCYLGEVVDFVKIRSGKNADITKPITLFQKIRYLDEEMGKMASVYHFDFDDAKYFEQFLTHSDEALNVFCPNDKCVSLVRVSRSNAHYGYMDTVYGPMLDKYEVYHGNTVGIIIRNGENAYIGWTDDEKINVQDDFFYSPEEERVVDTEDAEEVKNTTKEEFVSRYFLISLLQGVVDNGKLLQLPEKVRIMEPSKYVVFSYADAWITDNRFGTLRDIIDKVNGHYKVGNAIMMMESLRDGNICGGMGYNRYDREYERDHNGSKRTGDVSVKNGGIYKINLIEYEKYRVHTVRDKDGKEQRWSEQYSWSKYTDADFEERGVTLVNTEECTDPKIYISLSKSNYDYVYNGGRYTPRKREARANFRIFDGEFIDLTYLNSIWLKYVITTRNLGFSQSTREGNFAEMIRYLNIALQFIVKREEEEAELIQKYYPQLNDISEWQIKLSEWKLEHSVNNFTEYQAKRFAKYLEVI